MRSGLDYIRENSGKETTAVQTGGQNHSFLYLGSALCFVASQDILLGFSEKDFPEKNKLLFFFNFVFELNSVGTRERSYFFPYVPSADPFSHTPHGLAFQIGTICRGDRLLF